MTAAVEPFGLSFAEPLPVQAQPSHALSAAVLDQRRQVGVFNGRPLCELAAEDLMIDSRPTEKDGKDPINVDSDPLYD